MPGTVAAASVDPTESRRQRGLAIAAVCRSPRRAIIGSCRARPAMDRIGSRSTRRIPTVPMCTCPDFEERNQKCKHVFAVEYAISRERHPDGTETVTESVTVTRKTVADGRPTSRTGPLTTRPRRPRRTKFQVLLDDFCRGIRGAGRRRTAVHVCRSATWSFACAFKVFSTVSGRRFMCDLNDAHEKGLHRQGPALQQRLQVPGDRRP